jgi:3-oxoacyl-[acyl-carrier protein] reductase
MSQRFESTNVLVTGASRGIGASIAKAFGREGAHVFVGFRSREEEANAVVNQIKSQGGSAAPLSFNLKNKEELEAAFSACTQNNRSLDVVINNAAVSRDMLFPLLDDEAWADVIDTNLTGTARSCRLAAKHMWRAKKGVIVNIASVSGPAASPGQANYAASKGGVIALTRTLAAELAPRGIRVNAVVPGFIDTGMTTRLDKRILDERSKRIPLGRMGNADEVASVVLFLSSSESSYIIGQSIVVDGGLTL